MNTAWSVPRSNRPNPFTGRVRGLVLVVAGGLVLLATTGLSAIATSDVGSLGWLLRTATIITSLAINAAVFLVAFRIATTRDLRTRDVAPGVIALALLWQALQSFGITNVNRVIRDASATNGVFALVLGLLSFLPGSSRHHALRGDQRCARGPPVPEGALDAVHRRRPADPRGPQGIPSAGKGAAGEGVRAGRRELRRPRSSRILGGGRSVNPAHGRCATPQTPTLNASRPLPPYG